jgi:hypothetical protein
LFRLLERASLSNFTLASPASLKKEQLGSAFDLCSGNEVQLCQRRLLA